jgi:hypothetical protein
VKGFQSIDQAVAAFADAAAIHGSATEEGNSAVGNYAYKTIARAFHYLRSHDRSHAVFGLLENDNVAVRLWAARYLLASHARAATAVLRAIASEPGIHSLTAATTLTEWEAGRLKPFPA